MTERLRPDAAARRVRTDRAGGGRAPVLPA